MYLIAPKWMFTSIDKSVDTIPSNRTKIIGIIGEYQNDTTSKVKKRIRKREKITQTNIIVH